MTAPKAALARHEAQEPPRSLTITLPYSPYRVPIDDPWDRHSRESLTADLSKNAQLRMGARNQALVREAKRQMASDVTKLLGLESWGEMRCPLTMDARITTRTAAVKDDDGAWVGLYAARDAIAAALGINDQDMVTGRITWAKGVEETKITVRGV